MNNALFGFLGVIVGTVLSQLGTLLNSYLSSRKEERLWHRQQGAEEKKWLREEKKREREYLRDLYQKSIRGLAAFIAFDIDDRKKDTEKSIERQNKKEKFIEDIHNYTTLLVVRHRDEELRILSDNFTNNPFSHTAGALRQKISDLVHREDIFFLVDPPKNSISNSKLHKSKPLNQKTITIRIDDNFRKEQCKEGYEVPNTYKFNIALAEMSKSPREKLVNIYFKSGDKMPMPEQMELEIPIYADTAKKVVNKTWEAKLNPTTMEPNEILMVWDNEYDQAYKQAQALQDADNGA